ncbi:hypothetical protein SNEBB_007113 [Seison nebaliae]|nr:hypothetical protein SNEBB_007113 [Seison nebaliae]
MDVSLPPYKLGDPLVGDPERLNVPNHLLSTKIFNLESNESFPIYAEPSSLYFNIEKLNVMMVQNVVIRNTGAAVAHFHIIEPVGDKFKISYKKTGLLWRGSTLSIQVKYLPTSWEGYTDRILIHTEEEKNFAIPLIAQTHLSIDNIPKRYTFPHTALGDESVKYFKVKRTCPNDYDFSITIIQPSADISVSPLAGTVEPGDSLTIRTGYHPRTFSTCVLVFKLTFSDRIQDEFYCTLAGRCYPDETDRETRKFDMEITEKEQKLIILKKKVKSLKRTQEMGKQVYCPLPNLMNEKAIIGDARKLMVANFKDYAKTYEKLAHNATDLKQPEMEFLRNVKKQKTLETKLHASASIQYGDDLIDDNRRSSLLQKRESINVDDRNNTFSKPIIDDTQIEQNMINPYFDIEQTDYYFKRRVEVLERFRRAVKIVLIRLKIQNLINSFKKFQEDLADYLQKPKQHSASATLSKDVYHFLEQRRTKNSKNINQIQINQAFEMVQHSHNITHETFPTFPFEAKELSHGENMHHIATRIPNEVRDAEQGFLLPTTAPYEAATMTYEKEEINTVFIEYSVKIDDPQMSKIDQQFRKSEVTDDETTGKKDNPLIVDLAPKFNASKKLIGIFNSFPEIDPIKFDVGVAGHSSEFPSLFTSERFDVQPNIMKMLNGEYELANQYELHNVIPNWKLRTVSSLESHNRDLSCKISDIWKDMYNPLCQNFFHHDAGTEESNEVDETNIKEKLSKSTNIYLLNKTDSSFLSVSSLTPNSDKKNDTVAQLIVDITKKILQKYINVEDKNNVSLNLRNALGIGQGIRLQPSKNTAKLQCNALSLYERNVLGYFLQNLETQLLELDKHFSEKNK